MDPVCSVWGEPHKEFIACVAQHTRDRAYGGAKFPTNFDDMNFKLDYEAGESFKAWDGDNALLWVCAYANRQWSLGDDVTDDPSQTSFHKVRHP